MKNIFNIVYLILIAGFSIQCSSSGGGGSATASSAFNGAYEALKNNLPGSGATTSSLPIVTRGNHQHSGQNDWPLVDGGSSNNSFTDFIMSLVDESEEFSVLGRVKNSLMVACFLDLYGTKDSTGQLAVGSNIVIKMTRAWGNADCPGASETMDYLFEQAEQADVIDSAGEIPLTITVTDISDDGIYERKIEMPGDDNPQFGGSEQVMRLTVENGNVVFAHDEYDNPLTSRMTTFLVYNSSPELIRFQLSSQNSNINQVFRFYINDESNAAALLAYSTFGGGNTEILTTIASLANDLSEGAISQTYTDYNGTADGTDEEGCMNFDATTFNNTTYGSCNGITGISSSTANATMTTFNALALSAMAMTDTFTKNFTEANITTQAVH